MSRKKKKPVVSDILIIRKSTYEKCAKTFMQIAKDEGCITSLPTGDGYWNVEMNKTKIIQMESADYSIPELRYRIFYKNDKYLFKPKT